MNKLTGNGLELRLDPKVNISTFCIIHKIIIFISSSQSKSNVYHTD